MFATAHHASSSGYKMTTLKLFSNLNSLYRYLRYCQRKAIEENRAFATRYQNQSYYIDQYNRLRNMTFRDYLQLYCPYIFEANNDPNTIEEAESTPIRRKAPYLIDLFSTSGFLLDIPANIETGEDILAPIAQ